jgi:hypothetical protein
VVLEERLRAMRSALDELEREVRAQRDNGGRPLARSSEL